MSNASRLPAPMVLACYVAGGFCLFVSFQQMSAIFAAQGVEVGNAPLLPAAILVGGAVCWRLAGHMIARAATVKTFTASLVLVTIGAAYTELMSVGTSTMALSIGLHERAQSEHQASDQYQQVAATNAAAGRAVAELADRLETMPANYRTMAGQTAGQIERLIQQQARLTQMQADTGGTASAAAFAAAGNHMGMTGEAFSFAWAFGVALAITLIPLSIQLALGSLSDTGLSKSTPPPEAARGRTSDDPETLAKVSPEPSAGNVRSLSSVR